MINNMDSNKTENQILKEELNIENIEECPYLKYKINCSILMTKCIWLKDNFKNCPVYKDEEKYFKKKES